MIKKKHLPWLDLLRFIAAFEVLASHARGFLFVEFNGLIGESQNVFTAAFYALTRMGSEAVIIFFVLSGFLVGGKAMERLDNGSFRNKEYIIDRMVRIMLPLIPALALTVMCEFIASKSVSLIELVGNLFSLQGIFVKPLSGNAPLWSLSYEFWFYLLIFFVGGLLLSKAKNLAWFLGIVLVLSVFTVLNVAYLFCWIIGAVVYLYKSKKKSNMVFLLGILTFLGFLFLIQISLASKSLDMGTITALLPSLNILYILLSTAFAVFLQQLILRFPKRKLTIKINDMGAFLASFSYTLYLTHYPILGLFKNLGFEKYNTITLKSLVVYSVSLIFCLFIAYVIYLPFEKRTDYYKKLIKRSTNNA